MRRGAVVTNHIRGFFSKTFPVYNTILLVIVFILTAYPFLYIIMFSVSDPLMTGNDFLLWPKGFNLKAYEELFKNQRVLGAFLISVARSTIGPILSTLVTTMAAYGLSKRDLVGRKFLNYFFLLTMYFGAGLIPSYLLIKSLNLVGTFWVYVLPGVMSAYNMIIIRTYIEGVPGEVFESAYIDGANDLVIFFRIAIPICVPVIAAIMLFASVGQWNAYTDTLIYNPGKPELYPLQYLLTTIVSAVAGSASSGANIIQDMMAGAGVRITPLTVRMAITVVTVVPISLAYPFLQRYFMRGIMLGSVKG